MKLIIPHCKNCNAPILLNVKANNRGSLRMQMHGDLFNVKCSTCGYTGIYNVKNIVAKETSSETTTGAVVGGLVGLLGGPLGVIIGCGIGALIGDANDSEEKSKVKNFNESW